MDERSKIFWRKLTGDFIRPKRKSEITWYEGMKHDAVSSIWSLIVMGGSIAILNPKKYQRDFNRLRGRDDMENERRKKARRNLGTCKMCGKQLPETNMFRKEKSEDENIYLCCQICYEQFSGKPFSNDPKIEFE